MALLVCVEHKRVPGVMHLLLNVMQRVLEGNHYHHWLHGTIDMSFETYDHLIEIDETERLLTIYRVCGTERQLYTSVKMPEEKWAENSDAIKEFCRTLGENIILDSLQARKLFDI
jgi:hypothetical protein